MSARWALRMSVAGLLAGALFALGLLSVPTEAAPDDADQVLLVQPNGRWHIRVSGEADYTFWYGVKGDVALLGDWDGDGFDSPGMYRPSTGYVYLSNEIPADGEVGLGDPALTYFFGNPGDQVFVGDWDQDGIDTLGISRNGKMFLTNTHGTVMAEDEFWFGVPSDVAIGGSSDGVGGDGVFLYRPNTGFVYYTANLPVGDIAPTSGEFFFGDPGDRLVIGDWDGDGRDSAGLFRAADTTIHLRNTLNTGPADTTYSWGQPGWRPVAGNVALPAPVMYELRTSWGNVSGTYVSSSPPGIGCADSRSAICSALFPGGTEVSLTVRLEPGYRLVEWNGEGGRCGRDNPCTFTVDNDMFVYPVLASLYPIRVNAGGPLLSAVDGPDWEEDSSDNPSGFVNFVTGSPDNLTVAWPQPTIDSSVPASTPAAVFASERWDRVGGADMHWKFPVESEQWLEVRLYFASNYPGASDLVERLFDVEIDDWLVLDDYDIVADVGHQAGVMKRFVVKTDADGLDIAFSHTDPAVQNPLINAIEITVPERLVIVGGHSDPATGGAELLQELAYVTDQPRGSGNEWIIKLLPGVYQPSEPIVIPPYVELEGSGKSLTRITSGEWPAVGARAVAVIEGNGSLRQIGIEATDEEWSLEAVAILSSGGSPNIEGVTISLETIHLTGISVEGGSPRIRDVDVTSSESSNSTVTAMALVDSRASLANVDLQIWSGFNGHAQALVLINSTADMSSSTVAARNESWGSKGISLSESELRAKEVKVEATGGWHSAVAVTAASSTLDFEDVAATVDVNLTNSTAARFVDSTVTILRSSFTATDGDPPHLMNIVGSDVTMTDVFISSFEDTFSTGRGITLGDGALPPALLIESSTVVAPDWIITNNSTGTAHVRDSTLDGGPVLGSGSVVCLNVWDEHGTFYADTCPG